MRYKSITFLGLSAFAFLASSCATIMNGPNQAVGVISTPSDADVWVDQQYVGKSPIVLQLTRNQNHMIHLELEGFESHDIILSRKVSGWVFGNILIPGSIIGIAIDAYTGAIYRLTPDQIHADLENQKCIYTKRGEISSVSIVLKSDPNWEKIGQLTPS